MVECPFFILIDAVGENGLGLPISILSVMDGLQTPNKYMTNPDGLLKISGLERTWSGFRIICYPTPALERVSIPSHGSESWVMLNLRSIKNLKKIIVRIVRLL